MSDNWSFLNSDYLLLQQLQYYRWASLMYQQKDNCESRTKKAVSVKAVQLEVNVSIGKNKYLLQVQKCSNLHTEVQKFLKDNKLSIKYEGPILAMVRQELIKKGCVKIAQNQYIDELNKIKNQIDDKRKMQIGQPQNQQNSQKQPNQKAWAQNCQQNNSYYQKSNKENESHKINKEQSPSKHNMKNQKQSDINKCQNVYQKWKMKQKIKQQKKTSITPKKRSSKEKSVNKVMAKQQIGPKKQSSKKIIQAHEPDYFYQRGLKFQYAKQIHAEHLFKQKYPFQIHRQHVITPTKKAQLHERLYKQHKTKQALKIQKDIEERFVAKPTKEIDKYKQKVMERDNKINLALNYCIQNKMIQNPYRIQTVPKSPFRKTNCY